MYHCSYWTDEFGIWCVVLLHIISQVCQQLICRLSHAEMCSVYSRSGRYVVPLYREYDGVLAQVTQDESNSEVRQRSVSTLYSGWSDVHEVKVVSHTGQARSLVKLLLTVNSSVYAPTWLLGNVLVLRGVLLSSVVWCWICILLVRIWYAIRKIITINYYYWFHCITCNLSKWCHR